MTGSDRDRHRGPAGLHRGRHCAGQRQFIRPIRPTRVWGSERQLMTAQRAQIGFCGEWYYADPDREFAIGRDGDLQIDDNPYLHRRFPHPGVAAGAVVAGQRRHPALGHRLRNAGGTFQAWLAPGARLPLVFGATTVLFTAGSDHLRDSSIVCDDADIRPVRGPVQPATSARPPSVRSASRPSQKQLIVALAEPLLRRDGTSVSAIPSSKEAAARLGWEQTRFNRKLDNVCDKLDRRGVRGLRGGPGQSGRQPAWPGWSSTRWPHGWSPPPTCPCWTGPPMNEAQAR